MADRADWRGRRIVSADHAPELEARAAVLELAQGLPRSQAEARAHEEYLRGHLVRSAAHHLAGLRAAHAVGDLGDAAQHGLRYNLTARLLGFDPAGAPPDEVDRVSRDPDLTPMHDFKPHAADLAVLEHARRRDDLGKSEDDEPLGGREVDGGWDMTHLLPRLRRENGERLTVRDGPGGRTAHHSRLEAGRELPLSTIVDSDGAPTAYSGEPGGDVVRAAGLAFRIRHASDVARLTERTRGLAPLLRTGNAS